MKDKKIIIIYFLLVLYLVLRLLLFANNFSSLFTNVINPIFWITLSFGIYFIFKDIVKTGKYRYDKMQNIFIILITFFILYFLIGLFIGYQYSPYSHKLIDVFKNIIVFVPIIFLQEYVRGKVVALSYENRFNYFCISVVFAIIGLNFLNISGNFSTNADIFQYVCQIILPLIISNIVFTYLSFNVSWHASAIYRIFVFLIPIISPILPALNWLFTSIIDITLPVMVYFSVNNFDILKSRYIRRKRSKSSFLVNIIFFGSVTLFILFIIGILKYMPIAIMSNSMVPKFSRGDAVIVEKCDDNCLKRLKVYDIIYFRVDKNFIVHRIVDIIDENNEISYITKGDNNMIADSWIVKGKDIKGKVKFTIPYLGYPSVIISEFLFKEGE